MKNKLSKLNMPFSTAKVPSLTSTRLIVLMVSLLCIGAGQATAQIGTWTQLNNQAPDPNNGGMLLMTDGSVICHTSSGGTMGDGTIWDRLTPDSTGSYVNGTWSQIGPMNQERFSFSSEVLKDGRIYVAGGEYGTDGTQAGWHVEVYNPATNIWTEATGTSVAQTISDGSCKLLDNGDVLQALVDVSFPVHDRFYTPSTNALSNAPSTQQGSNESMWLKLPDNSVLMVDEDSTSSERYIPSLNQWISDSAVPVSLYDPYGYECGPGWMLPDGRAFFIGGTNNTAFYTPSGTNSPGVWAAGPVVPNGYSMPDAPGAMLPNGHILFASSPQPTAALEFATPTAFYEFNYLDSSYTSVPVPSAAASNSICQQYDMVLLPNGQVLLGLSGDATSQVYYVYTPAGAPVASGKPAITGVTKLTCTTFMATGHGFNGISEGAAFGDENESDSNYPLFRFTSGGKVYYARSYNWNSAGVQRGLANNDTAYFELPANMTTGSYYMYAVANGIASDSVAFSDSIPLLSSTLAPPAICTATAFTYTATSPAPGATFTWTRPAVTGISNAAVTTPQSGNPNEVLVNTTPNPITVNYVYGLSAYGCVNYINIPAVVNPVPTAAFTALPAISCTLPDTVTYVNTSLSGTSYVWSFGDGGTSTDSTPVHTYAASGSFDVKLVASSICGTDSLTKSGYIVVTAPPGPAVNGAIHCGDMALTISATSNSSGVAWFDSLGNYLSNANPFTTPVLSHTTTYFVQDSTPGLKDSVGPAKDVVLGATAVYTHTRNHGVVFNAVSNLTILSVRVYASTAGSKQIQLIDSAGNILASSTTFTLVTGLNVLPLNFSVAPGNNYELYAVGGTGTANLIYNNAVPAGSYPFTVPAVISLTGSGGNPADYYFLYDWHIQGPSCISARTPVTAIIGGCLGIGPVQPGISFSIYPNPASSEVTVDIQEGYEGAVVTLRDMLGQTLLSRPATASQITLDVHPYASGIYFVEVSAGGTKAVRKLVVSGR